MPTVRDLLASKESPKVHTIAPGATVLDAVEAMNERKIGALLVTDEGHVVGIFSERDVLRRVIGEMRRPSETRLKDVMTPDVFCVEPDTDLDEVSTLMKDHI